mmetsp:Transcript_123757/g.283751  ORF Transcript_123757/g.283751 Transcript_123757/m.283751 type:complete len:159 (-) Transcript_123757:231-707(-)
MAATKKADVQGIVGVADIALEFKPVSIQVLSLGGHELLDALLSPSSSAVRVPDMRSPLHDALIRRPIGNPMPVPGHSVGRPDPGLSFGDGTPFVPGNSSVVQGMVVGRPVGVGRSFQGGGAVMGSSSEERTWFENGVQWHEVVTSFPDGSTHQVRWHE